mmetsp:Transcript_26487/g.106017  ORF Transcript_26487/g.106017 Transcript_26487/m.106017 type:complete len:339 (-) Transcript_26487:947-1963(-)
MRVVLVVAAELVRDDDVRRARRRRHVVDVAPELDRHGPRRRQLAAQHLDDDRRVLRCGGGRRRLDDRDVAVGEALGRAAHVVREGPRHVRRGVQVRRLVDRPERLEVLCRHRLADGLLELGVQRVLEKRDGRRVVARDHREQREPRGKLDLLGPRERRRVRRIAAAARDSTRGRAPELAQQRLGVHRSCRRRDGGCRLGRVVGIPRPLRLGLLPVCIMFEQEDRRDGGREDEECAGLLGVLSDGCGGREALVEVVGVDGERPEDAAHPRTEPVERRDGRVDLGVPARRPTRRRRPVDGGPQRAERAEVHLDGGQRQPRQPGRHSAGRRGGRRLMMTRR